MKIEANPMSVATAVAGGLLPMLGGCDVDRHGEFDSAELERSAEQAGAEMADAAEEGGRGDRGLLRRVGRERGPRVRRGGVRALVVLGQSVRGV